jgi:hypothetical protein
LCIGVAACGPRRVNLPTDSGSPLADSQKIYADVSDACAGVRTFEAELGLAGRAGAERLRGRIRAGFEAPASMRLEAVAPLGQPVFILAARGTMATLLFPRQDRVVREATADAILGALTGVTLGAADLHAVLTGCVVPAPRSAAAGRLHANGWASLDVAGGSGKTTATMYLREIGGRWQLAAARRGPWQIEYDDWQGSFARLVRLRSQGTDVAVDLATTISQLETNMPINPAAFDIDVPADARPMTVDELRAAGPLRGQ